MKTKSFLKKLQKLQKKSDVDSIHALRIHCRKMLSLISADDQFYTALKKIIKLTNKIRDLDVFLQEYLDSLPKEHQNQIDLKKIQKDTNKSRKKQVSKLHAFIASLDVPKYIELENKQSDMLQDYNREALTLNQTQLHKYRIHIKKRLYVELNNEFADEEKVKILTSIKDLLGTINDNFNALKRLDSFSIDHISFEQIYEYTQTQNKDLYEKFKKLDKQYREKESMKKLYIIRHAKSSWKDSSLDDFDRPLNKRGQKDAPFMGKKLKEKHIFPDIIISSAALRAKTTVQLIAKELGYTKDILFSNDIYDCSSDTLHKILTKMDDTYKTVFLCGHNPELNMLVEMYIDFDENIVTCGIVEIEFSCEKWADISAENAKLLSFEYPKKIFN
ncbi:MAG: CHAD domain-containing protein [Helicobacteraceae bacterium]|nr:CHAD domain-containing protein [Candidatus Sulfurimonas ponti]MBL6972771.1 CHAD domain-containing protein [Sulfurimonas sp.]